jgi:hypothetical protein
MDNIDVEDRFTMSQVPGRLTPCAGHILDLPRSRLLVGGLDLRGHYMAITNIVDLSRQDLVMNLLVYPALIVGRFI